MTRVALPHGGRQGGQVRRTSVKQLVQNRSGRRPQLVKLDTELTDELQPGALDGTKLAERDTMRGDQRFESSDITRRKRHDRAGTGFGEQRHERIQFGRKRDSRAETAPNARLHERLREAAVGKVVYRRPDPVTGTGNQQRRKCPLGLEVDGRGRPPRWSCTTCAHSLPPSSSRVDPSR